MSLSTIGQAIQQYTPSREQITQGFSISLTQAASKLNKIALPAIALYAACNTPGAEAGFGLAALVYVGTNIAGGVLVAVGTVTAPIGGAVLIGAGVAAITAAPYTLAVTLPIPTP